jgi:hypothetical protein
MREGVGGMGTGEEEAAAAAAAGLYRVRIVSEFSDFFPHSFAR